MEKVIIIGSGLALCTLSFIGGFNVYRKMAIENITKLLSSEDTKDELIEKINPIIMQCMEKYKREDGYFIPLDEM